MFDIKFVRDNPETVKEGALKKGVAVDVALILKVDEERRELIGKVERLKAEQKKLGKDKIEEAQRIKEEIKRMEPELVTKEKDLQSLLFGIPNLPLEDVPVAENEEGNVVLEEVGEKPDFSFKPKSYLEIAEKLDLIDIKRAAKISGSRFGFIKGKAALLEFALIRLAIDFLAEKGFIPVIPPVMLKPEMARGMGYLEQTDDEEAYFLPKDNLYLTATSEQALGTMHSGEVFEEKDLPRRYAGFSTCFRREAGSYGKDTKGILRVHQFDKVEMFSFVKPGDSGKEHQLLLEIEKDLMSALKIPYQVIRIASGDLGIPAASKYDIEAWIPSEKRYRETHSTSNCTDFQARRLNIRYQKKGGSLEYVHTLNGTAFAIGRTLIAIIENYQQKDGSIEVPKVLQKYTGFKEIK
ncbi:MAG: serine--tRNA ligase [bacterium]|nr:serine--tRNA ligase [bacterium]